MTNTATFQPHFNVDDLVQVHPQYAGKYAGITYRVTAVPGGSRTKVAAEPVAGGRGLKGHPELFIGTGHAAWVGPKTVAEPETPVAPLVLGTVITLKSRAGFFVITGETAGKFRAALLGGDDNAYVKGITRASIDRIFAPAEFTLMILG